MAKIRRIIRKAAHTSGDYFDEKIWPVYIALVILGAFLMGVSAAYLKFSGVPWYANALTSLVAIPLVVVGFMIAFRFIGNRLVRRSMQLAVVASAILHLVMVVQMIETRIFSAFDNDVVVEREVIEPRKPKLIPQYQPQQMLPEEDRPKQDFEKPLEVKAPEPQPEPENVARQETQPETTQAPPQPVPTPQPVVSAQPNVVKRNEPNEVAPRAGEQMSKLSRQSKPSELKISQLVQSLPIEQPRPAGVEARAAAARIERQSTELAATPNAMDTPQSPAAAAPQLARKSDTPAPTVDATATATLKRQVAEPTHTPTSPIAAADAPPQPKSTSPEALTPASTFTQRQSTASPQITRTDAPLPEIASAADAPLSRRQSPAETAPQVAQSPSPTPNQQPRMTTRPDVAATAAIAAPTAPSPSAAAATQPAPQTSRIERAAAAVSGSQARAIPSTEPTTSPSAVAAARPTRTEGSQSPSVAANPNSSATMTRRTGTPSIAAATAVQSAATGTVTSSATSDLAAASTATRRQPSASAQASPAAGEPSAAQLAALSPQATANNSAMRRATGTPADVPTTGPAGPTTPSQSRSTTPAVANVVTRAANVPTNAGPQTADSSLPGPSRTAVARQASSPADSASTPAAAAVPDAGTVAMASGAIARAQASQVPTIRPQVTAGNSPARATADSPAPQSAAAIDSPAVSVAASGAPSTPQPARLAISRAESGTAGVGRSPNLDRAMPGSESPALVASAAARRAEATTQTPGDSLAPSSPALIARAAAAEPQPTATVRVESPAGNAPGAAEVAQLAASSSATLNRADSQAMQAAVTGAKGTTDVDIGPTQVVAERGGTRAAGGGQSDPSTELTAAQVARTAAGGGLPQIALAAPKAESTAAPAGESGGLPAAMEAQVAGIARTSPSTSASAAGGPQTAEPTGASSAATAAQLVAPSEISRAQASDGAAGGGAAGLADAEDEQEKARRLARAAEGGAPQLAVSGPVMADAVASPPGDGGDAGAARAVEATAIATTTSRMTAKGGAPAGGAQAPVADAGSPAEAGGAAAAANVAIARAEAADGVPGSPLVGGGSESPAKASSAPTFAANTTAETIQLAGAPASSGAAAGIPLAASGTQTERMTGGASGPVSSDPQGAVAGDEALLSARGVAPARGQRQEAGGAAQGPPVADAPATAALAKSGAAAGPSSSAIVADIPEVGAGSAVAQAELDHMMGGTANTPMTRQSGEALAVAAAAPEGPGGLGTEYSPEVGLNSRKAREESINVQTAATRFVRTSTGGLPAFSTTAIVSREPFVKRSARLSGDQGGSGRGASSPQTNAAIEAGLAFLARHQHPDGHWSLQGFDDATNAVSEDERRFMLVSDTGATALAILAFQGGGYTHREHRYQDVLRRGISHLLTYQKQNGDLFVPTDDRSNQSVWLYSHALATLALCEAYGMTGDPALKEPAQRAVSFIVATQNRDLGGWRYSPEFDARGAIIGGIGTDTSVTGWMVAALYSAKLAELEVPSETFARIEKWMNSAQGAGGEAHLYRYNPYAPDTAQQRHGRVPSKTMTAVGLLSREFLGWKPDHPALARGAEFLSANRPAIGTAREPQRDTYYWYYATLALVYLKERNPDLAPAYEKWEATLHPLLSNSQERQGPWAGSWNPRGPVPDRWGLHAGRLYVTTMNLLSLEANYRYLPVHSAVQGQSSEARAASR